MLCGVWAGVVRRAAPTTPVLPSPGNSAVFDLAAPPGVAALSRALRAAIVWPSGLGGLPIPLAAPILSVVGDPVEVAREADPSQATVDAVHAAFVASLVAAFEGHKHLAGAAYAGQTLEVV